MEGKRILPWKEDINGWTRAVTLVGTWQAHAEGFWRGGGWQGTSAQGDLASAQAICEADYLARCSEFLPVAGPGECVVDAGDAKMLLEYWFANQIARESGCGEIGNAARRIRDAIKEARYE